METNERKLKAACYALALTILFIASGCRQEKEPQTRIWEPYNDSLEVAGNQDHPVERMRYKLIQSKILDKNDVFLPLYEEVKKFSREEYLRLKPMIFEQPISTLQKHIKAGDLSYEELTLFYLYRIYTYELNNETTLNTVLALNPNCLQEAREKDRLAARDPDGSRHPIFGMPILLKDNINTAGMPTTAGAIALKDNTTGDSFITERLRSNGAIFLGKVNLSEWAYFMCRGCPVGYSAVGGQTLNPYGRRTFESGGSSSGSGTAVAANYAVAAVGTETSGSILSPSSQNSVVGIKPTIGFLSRSGIVPISSTLDTPGPMTRNVADAGILLDAMKGRDTTDAKSVETGLSGMWYQPEQMGLQGKRLGVFKGLLERDSLYREQVERMRQAGAEIIPFDPPEVNLDGFITLLNIDMKIDLPRYLKNQIRDRDAVRVSSVADVVAFNREDSLLRVPYGQMLLEGIVADSTSLEELEEIRMQLEENGRRYFDTPWEEHQLDAVLSVNNYHAGYAAVAKYPALTVPMGYRDDGEPTNMTFIAKPFEEDKLIGMGQAYEQLGPMRRPPAGYNE
ncbi:amidase family protein [Robiginitalea sp. IMCC43444]|uniref:amidase family protein n=1 Tax=Robiginitalea sp. IMCC43444 TaxID=3459121 RepID=UPI004041765C